MSRPGLLTLLLCQTACFAPMGKDLGGGSTTGTTSPSATTEAAATSDTGDTAGVETSSHPTTGSPGMELRSCTWKQIGKDGPPPPRYGHSLDLAANGTLLMFAGRATLNAGPNLGDVWQYKNEWELLTPPLPELTPTPRRGFAAAVHPDLGLVIFGGDDDLNNSSNSFTTETWAYADEAWKQLPSITTPIGSSYAAMEYHPPSDKLVLYGGHDIHGTMLTNTWTLGADGQWTEVATNPAPQPRAIHSMAREPGGDLLLHGGCTVLDTCNKSALDDTWRWNGAWTKVDDGDAPLPYGGAMTPGTADGTLFRFGRGPQNIETYQWLGDRWEHLNNPSANPPATMEKFAVAYYPATNDVLLFGGLRSEGSNSETWTFHCDDQLGP